MARASIGVQTPGPSSPPLLFLVACFVATSCVNPESRAAAAAASAVSPRQLHGRLLSKSTPLYRNAVRRGIAGHETASYSAHSNGRMFPRWNPWDQELLNLDSRVHAERAADDEDDDDILPEDREVAMKVMAGDIKIIDEALDDYDSIEEMVDDVDEGIEEEEQFESGISKSVADEEDDQYYWENTGDETSGAALNVDQALEMMNSEELTDQNEIEQSADPFDLEFDEQVIGNDDSQEFAIALANAMSDVKATNISITYVRKIRSYTSYVVIGTVFSRPQTDAVKKKVGEEAEGPTWNRKRVCERQDEAKAAGWHCVDYGDVIMHIMTPDQREYYDLDTLYSKGESIEVPGLTGIIDDFAAL